MWCLLLLNLLTAEVGERKGNEQYKKEEEEVAETVGLMKHEAQEFISAIHFSFTTLRKIYL